MSWRVEITAPAQRDLRRLDLQTAQRVLRALQRLSEDGTGDVRPLRGLRGQYRLRVGDWRIRFERDPGAEVIYVLHVLPRGRAYRD